MKIKNYIIAFILFAVLMCCISNISAISDNNTENNIYEIDSDSESVSVSDDGNVINDECNSILSSQADSNNLTESEEPILYANEEDNLEISDIESNKYLEDIKSSTSEEYYKFIDYLIKQKGFQFNTKSTDDAYTIFSNLNYESKLYDGSSYILLSGNPYVISKNRLGYVIDEYYPDILYFQNNNTYLDELYLGWLKWIEDYHLTLNIGGTKTLVSISATESSIQSASQNLPSSYDLRNVNGNNYVTPIKNQGDSGNCWAFASIAALESFLLKTEGVTYDFSSKFDFSENNLKNVMSSIGRQGSDYNVNAGGSAGMAIAYFLRWSGPISEELDKYELINNIPLEFNNSEKHVQGIKYIHTRNGPTDNDEIKQAIMDYGGVAVSMSLIQQFPFLDISKTNYYYGGTPTQKDSNENSLMHEICVIGWDDTYSRFNFANIPDGDGAFIVKNSWGTAWGDNGYFYVSYYDTGFAHFGESEINNAVGFAFTSVQDNANYDFNYHYTPLGATLWANNGQTSLKYRNKWTASYNELLKSCGIYVDSAVNCDINVFVNNQKVGELKNIQLTYAGYHTVNFKEPIKISKNQNFIIEVTVHSSNIVNFPVEMKTPWDVDGFPYSKASSNIGESEIFNYNQWIDINTYFSNSNICLNAYTTYDYPLPTKIDSSD